MNTRCRTLARQGLCPYHAWQNGALPWLTVTTANDIAGTGIVNQRVNQVSDNVYGEKSINSYLNPSAFALPAAGTLGSHKINSIEGPGFWTVDVAVSRLVSPV